tara:strand:- start:126 stop:518 length:393 start_codon:yes stop_codon:yes gene_type:complete
MAKNKKGLNLNELPTLNLDTGRQYSAANTKFFSDNPELGKFASKLARTQGTPGNPGSYIPMIFGEMILRKPESFRGEFTSDKGTKMLGKFNRGYKKGGKVKAKKPKDGRMKKAKCRDGIAQRGKTRGRMR